MRLPAGNRPITSDNRLWVPEIELKPRFSGKNRFVIGGHGCFQAGAVLRPGFAWAQPFKVPYKFKALERVIEIG